MKQLFTIFGLSLIVYSSVAETVITNRIASPDLREVGGKIYNIKDKRSGLFSQISIRGAGQSINGTLIEIGAIHYKHFAPMVNSSQSIGAYAPAVSSGGIVDYFEPESRAILKNGPPLAMDQIISLRAVKTGILEDGFAVWDCGAPCYTTVLTTNFTPYELQIRKDVLESTGKVKVFQFCLEQARAGSGPSQLRVAKMYLNGDGTDKNEREATKWLYAAQANGEAESAKLIAELNAKK